MLFQSRNCTVEECEAPKNRSIEGGVRLPFPTYSQTSGATNDKDSAAPTTTAKPVSALQS